MRLKSIGNNVALFVGVLVLSGLTLSGLSGCGGGSLETPTADDSAHTEQMIMDPTIGMPGGMSTSSPAEQAQKAGSSAAPSAPSTE